ncbi:MAG: DUF5689 domain-containing protein [Psychroflexus maritimus]
MKKITLLLTLLISAFALAQTPVLTMISDGDCSGGNPKVVEIYAQGTVDFANYSLEIQTNANDTWGNALNLADLGVITDDFVYIHKEDDSFATEYPSASNVLSTTSSTVNFNGDDRIRIIEDASTTVIDQYGEEATDGSGEVWEYQDGYAKRNNSTGPDAGFFAGNWSFSNGALDGEGTCQGGSTFESIIGIGTYTPGSGNNDPSVFIDSPANNAVLNPGTTSVDVSFSTQNEPDGAQFDITVNGSTTTGVTSPFNLTTQNGETYAVEVELLEGQSVVASATIEFSVADIIQVQNITELRADFEANGEGRFYEITGVSTMSHADGFNNRKWFQDDSFSGIMIYDQSEVIAEDAYEAGDQVTNLVGETAVFNGVLQLVPSSDNGVVVGNQMPATQIITLSQYLADFETYESTLVGFENVSFVDADGTLEFGTGQNYDFTDGQDTSVIRTEFFSADYIGTIIPTGTLDGLRGVGSQFNGTAQIFPRDSEDINVVLSINGFEKTQFRLQCPLQGLGLRKASRACHSTHALGVLHELRIVMA